MTRAIWIVTSTLFGLMTCLVIGQFPIEIRQGVTPSDFPNERTLICRVSTGEPDRYNPIENAIFYLNGNDIRDELPGSDVEYSASTGTITIQLRQELEGYYTCGDGTTTSPESVILVYFPSRDPDLDLYHVVAVGEEMVLPCGVNQGPLASRYTVRWYRDENFLRLLDTQSSGSRYRLKSEVLEDFSLIIADTFLSDSNRYHCEVEVEIVAGSPTNVDSGEVVLVELLVSDRPMITYMTDDIIPFISTATDVEFVCNATGSPNLIVTWFHNDKKIVPNDKYSVESNRSTAATIHSRLTIKNADLTDSSHVTCVASITFQADTDGAEEDALTRSRTAQLVVLDDSLILNPFVTRESHLLLDISLRDVLLDQNMKILVRIINYVNQSQTRVIPVQGEYSRSTILYPFIRNSQLPKVEEGFQKFRIQVALIINGKTGPYSPRAADLQEQVPVDLSEGPTVGPLAPAETDDTMIIATSASGAATVLTIVIVVAVAVVICCKFKTVRYERRQESRERKMEFVNDQLTMLYDLLGTPTSPEQLAIIKKDIDRNNGYIHGTKGVPGLIRVDGVTETRTGLTQEGLRKQIEDLKKAAAKKKTECGRKKQHRFLRWRMECCENERCQETQV